MNAQFSFDTVTLILVVCGFVPFFTWRALRAFKRKRYSKFAWCIVLNLYMIRLAYLRVSTQGGKVGIYDPSVLQFTRELGDQVVFFIATLLLLIFAVIRVLDDDRFMDKAYVKREDYDLLVAKLEALKEKEGGK
jgi:ABC-type branched-subunit amino acid transport system permease subunit